MNSKQYLLIISILVFLSPTSIKLYGQCENTSLYPNSNHIISCETNIITTNQYATEYNVSEGFLVGESYQFSSSNPTDYITLRKASDNTVISHGTTGATQLTILYMNSYGNIEMHINTDDQCNTETGSRTTSIEAHDCCEATVQNPGSSVNITDCFYQEITTNQNTGEYNVTTGLGNGTSYIFTSSIPTDHITLKDALTNTVLTQGTGSASLLYNTSMGEIEMHVFSDDDCSTDSNSRTTSVSSETNQYPNQTVNIQCGLNIIEENQNVGEHNLSTNYKAGATYVFESSVATDFIILRDNSNHSIIKGSGLGSVTLSNLDENIIVEMHVFSDNACATDNGGLRTTSITAPACCDASIQNPMSAVPITSCTYQEITTNQNTGEYNVTTGLQDFTNYIFASSNPADHIILRDALTNTILTQGTGSAYLLYDTSMGDIEMHVFGDVLCSTDSNTRTTSISSINIAQHPSAVHNVICSTNIITTSQQASEYNVSTGFESGGTYQFTSSISNDFIVLRDHSDQSIIIGSGLGSVSVSNLDENSTVEMHIYKNNSCETEAVNRTTSIIAPTCCNASSQIPMSAVPITSCTYQEITTSQNTGEYNVTTGLKNGTSYTFTSSNPTDNITLRVALTNTVISQGTGSASLLYDTSMGDIEMHVFGDVLCSTDGNIRTTSVSSISTIQYPPNIFNIICGIDTIAVDQYAGEYNLSTGFVSGGSYQFSSSLSNDFIVLRDHSDQSIIIGSGLGSVSVSNLDENSTVEMHIYLNNSCETEAVSRITSIIAPACCNASSQNPMSAVPITSCTYQEITTSQNTGEYNVTTGLINGANYIFGSSNPADHITLKDAATNTVLSQGTGSVQLAYTSSLGNIEMHVFGDVLCSTDGSTRTTSVSIINTAQYPLEVYNITCGIDTIADDQSSGEYNVSTGFASGGSYQFTSSLSTDFIVLRDHSVQGIIIGSGLGSVTTNNLDENSIVEMHIYTDNQCSTDNNVRITSITSSSCQSTAFGLAITEYMVQSGSFNLPWIEVYNYYPSDIDLTNTEIKIDNTSYIIPNGTIIGGGEYLVFTSNKTSFEELWLNDVVNPQVVELSGLTFPPQAAVSIMKSIQQDTFWSIYYDMNNNSKSNYLTINDFSNRTMSNSVNPLNIDGTDLLVNNLGYESQSSTNTSDPDKYSALISSIEGSPLLGIYTTLPDTDDDGVLDTEDNCVSVANPLQLDQDNDGIGDVCDLDLISENNVGIGIDSPRYKLHVDGNLFIDKSSGGILMRSETKCWILRINDTGGLYIVETECSSGNSNN